MKKKRLLLFLLLIAAIQLSAQNPIIRDQFAADPTARVFNNKVYVYPSHDIPAPEGQRQDWFCMADYHVFSSENLTDWQDHGMILSQEQVPWGKADAYSMWAPDCVEKDGKYYFYFPNAPKNGRGFAIGVATGNSPTGPFAPQPEPIKGVMGIDPCVLIDDDGQAYLYWSAMGIRGGKLKDNMLELDGELQTISLPQGGTMQAGGRAMEGLPEGFKEGPFAFKRGSWYYLLGTHGTCCDGVNSTYNIVVGRSRSVEGPYLDNVGRDMLHGGGRMVLAAGDRLTGPGHFGRTVFDEGVELMSCHFEADFERSGRSVLGIRPLVWKNDWPVAGEQLKEGTYAILSERRGYSLELTVDFVRIPQDRQAFWRMDPNAPVSPIADQRLEDVIGTWPEGNIAVRLSDYMFRPHQHWTVVPQPESGGTLAGPLYQIKIAGTSRVLTVGNDLQLTTCPFEGRNEQLWRIEQCTDGTFRIMPFGIPGQQAPNTRYCLYSAGDSTPTIAPWDFNSDNSKWNFRKY